MKLVIVGAGKVAYYMIRELTRDYEVVIIEQDELAACKIANQLNAVVVRGDGTSAAVLEPVCRNADIFIALTGKDENNLIACQIAKRMHHVPVTIARVNNPKNLEVMRKFGVDKSFSGTKVLAEMIEQEVDYQGLRIVHVINRSDRVLVEFVLSASSKAAGKTLLEYDFISGARVVVITKESGEVITPDGATVMNAGDTIMMVCTKKSLETIWKDMVRA